MFNFSLHLHLHLHLQVQDQSISAAVRRLIRSMCALCCAESDNAHPSSSIDARETLTPAQGLLISELANADYPRNYGGHSIYSPARSQIQNIN